MIYYVAKSIKPQFTLAVINIVNFLCKCQHLQALQASVLYTYLNEKC